MESLQTIFNIDQQLLLLLAENEFNTEEMLALVDKRELIINSILDAVNGRKQSTLSAEWQDVILRTEQIITLMQSETDEVGRQLHKLQHSNKSMLQYKKFL